MRAVEEDVIRKESSLSDTKRKVSAICPQEGGTLRIQVKKELKEGEKAEENLPCSKCHQIPVWGRATSRWEKNVFARQKLAHISNWKKRIRFNRRLVLKMKNGEEGGS